MCEQDNTATLAMDYANEQYKLSLSYAFCTPYLDYVISKTKGVNYLIDRFL